VSGKSANLVLPSACAVGGIGESSLTVIGESIIAT